MLQVIIDWCLYSALGLSKESRLIQSLNFFIYDSIKILALLFILISLIGFLRAYIPQKKIKQWISDRKFGLGNFLASLFGAITPFCSCSSIPILLGFLEAGIPLGVAFSFLITPPIINGYLFVLMLGFFGIVALAIIFTGYLFNILQGLLV